MWSVPWRRPKPLVAEYPYEVLARLSDAVRDGSEAELAAWAATGRIGVQLLHDISRGAVREPWGRVSGQLLMDTVPAAFAEIAERHPEDFLEVFADPRWDRDRDALAGFGAIDDPRATQHLVQASLSRSKWTRMWAAVGLPAHVSPETTDALIRLAADSDYLVRYHAINGLRTAGDEHAAVALRALPANDEDRERVDAAIRDIEDRTRRGEPARGRETEIDLLPSEIERTNFQFGWPGHPAPPLSIEHGTLVLQTEAGRVEVIGTPFWTGSPGGQPGFRAATPLDIVVDGQRPDDDVRKRAIQAVADAAEECRLPAHWPPGVLPDDGDAASRGGSEIA